MKITSLDTLSISHTIQRIHHVFKAELGKRNTTYKSVKGIGGIAGELTDVWAFSNGEYTMCVVVQRMQPSDQMDELRLLLAIPQNGVYLGTYKMLDEEDMLDDYSKETLLKIFAHISAFPGGHTDYDLPQLIFDDFAAPAP